MSDKEIAMQLTLTAMERNLIHYKMNEGNLKGPEIAIACQKLVADFYTAMYEAVSKTKDVG